MPPMLNANRPVPKDRRTLAKKADYSGKYTHKGACHTKRWRCIALASISSLRQSSVKLFLRHF